MKLLCSFGTRKNCHKNGKSIIAPIHNKGDKMDYNNYRRTSCLIRLHMGCVPNEKMRHNLSLEIKLQLKYKNLIICCCYWMYSMINVFSHIALYLFHKLYGLDGKHLEIMMASYSSKCKRWQASLYVAHNSTSTFRRNWNEVGPGSGWTV